VRDVQAYKIAVEAWNKHGYLKLFVLPEERLEAAVDAMQTYYEKEVETLRAFLWEIYAATGCDTMDYQSAPPKGCMFPDIEEMALEAVKELRIERDKAVETGEY
jgi:hypothetical protein